MDINLHESVLVEEVIGALHIEKGHKYIDCTEGNGGHTLEILRLGGQVLGIDLDPKMLTIANQRLKEAGMSGYKLVNDNFTNIDKVVVRNDWKPVHGILLDLGVTNLHLKDMERGFSFENPDAPLDMRIDAELEGVKAADLLNVLREDQLRDLFEGTL
jgi:16S rRNA (cytosine1402-N4)-methyltransferase